MRGKDLATNLEFHYGLVNWFIGQNINARPTTRFIVPYLTAVGELKQRANNLDLAYAWQQLCKNVYRGACRRPCQGTSAYSGTKADFVVATSGVAVG